MTANTVQSSLGVEQPHQDNQAELVDVNALFSEAFSDEMQADDDTNDQNDAIDEAPEAEEVNVAVGPEHSDAEAQDNSEADDLAETLMAEVLAKPNFGFSHAREFMGQERSINGFVSGLRKPKTNAQSLLNHGAEHSAHEDLAQLPQDQQRVQLSLGKAALLAGGLGLAKLGSAIGQGGGMVGQKIFDYIDHRESKSLSKSLDALQEDLNAVSRQGLDSLLDQSVSLGERQVLAEQFFSKNENKLLLNQLNEQVDQIKLQAKRMVERGIKRGDDPDEVLTRVLEPLKQFTDDNESLLESIKKGDSTLLDKMDGVLDSLFDLLKKLFERLTRSQDLSGVNSQSTAQHSAPRMG